MLAISSALPTTLIFHLLLLWEVLIDMILEDLPQSAGTIVDTILTPDLAHQEMTGDPTPMAMVMVVDMEDAHHGSFRLLLLRLPKS